MLYQTLLQLHRNSSLTLKIESYYCDLNIKFHFVLSHRLGRLLWINTATITLIIVFGINNSWFEIYFIFIFGGDTEITHKHLYNFYWGAWLQRVSITLCKDLQWKVWTFELFNYWNGWFQLLNYLHHSRTISQQKKEPPLLRKAWKDHHQQEVEHDAFTQHPAEDTEEKVVQQSCYKNTGSLGKQCLQLTTNTIMRFCVQQSCIICGFID